MDKESNYFHREEVKMLKNEIKELEEKREKELQTIKERYESYLRAYHQGENDFYDRGFIKGLEFAMEVMSAGKW